MERPRSQPRTVFQRVQSKGIRKTIFRPHKDVIKRLYIDEDRPLKETMAYMKETYGINQSVKQYKSQLKSWGFRHKLTLRDAAFTLRLLDQAKERGLDEVVLFSGQPRRREDIQKYISRNPKLADENALLAYISDVDETPGFIKIPPFPIAPRKPTPSQRPPTPPSGNSSDSLDPTAVRTEISPMRVPLFTPEESPRSSSEWLRNPNDVSGGSTPSLGVESRGTNGDRTQDLLPMREITAGTQSALSDIMDPFWRSDDGCIPSDGWQSHDNNDPTMHWDTDLTNAALSVTPAVVPQVNIYRFGDHTHSRQLNDGSQSGQFVTNCLFWLICVGQNDPQFQEQASYHLNSALISYLCMVQNLVSPGEECLGALSVVAALFDCYGQWERLSELLTRCEEVTKIHLPGDNPLTMTIAFKKNMLQHKGGSGHFHDVPRLREVYHQMLVQFPKSPGPALTARYNLAWAMLENELKKDVKNCEQARQELQNLTAQCDAHFGPDRIETIMAAATWARATFKCGRVEEAEDIIARMVFPRVRKNFPENHPYIWEAKHRHAFLLFQLAKKEPGSRGSSHLLLGEHLLREVVRDRHRILGDSNPKSAQSFRLLRDILLEQGKVAEAYSLWQWCQRELAQYGRY